MSLIAPRPNLARTRFLVVGVADSPRVFVVDAPRVLVVDDDARFGMAVTALLESAGITVVGRAEDGQSALALAAALRPNVVTMDIDMPVMDGVEATRRLRVKYPDLPVILLTGSTSSDRVEEALRGGAVCAVSKAKAAETLARVIIEVWTGLRPSGEGAPGP